MNLGKIKIGGVLLILATMGACSKDDTNTNVTILGSNSSVATSSVRARATAGSPTSMKMQVYGLFISTSEDCSSPVTVFDNATSTEFDMYAAPTLFAGVITPGTYKCVIIKASDNFNFKVDATAVSAKSPECADTTTEYTMDIYRSDNGGDVFKDLNGATITATGTNTTPSADVVYLVASTIPASATAYDTNQKIPLSAALVVPGSSTFYVDFSNGIDNTSGHCGIEDGTGFGFR